MPKCQCNFQHLGNNESVSSHTEQARQITAWQQLWWWLPQQQNRELHWHGCPLGLLNQLQKWKIMTTMTGNYKNSLTGIFDTWNYILHMSKACTIEIISIIIIILDGNHLHMQQNSQIALIILRAEYRLEQCINCNTHYATAIIMYLLLKTLLRFA